ncbi:hypothetical protein CQ007_07325 [Pseudomonas sp. MYb185]|nr:hypothetical protein CQ007_07325 [Pseudomonas sp. MYb185]
MLSLSGLLTACLDSSGGSSGNSEATPPVSTPAMAALEESGEIPRLDRSTDLAGLDTDQDGVRDDIQTHIDSHYTDQAQRNAALQAARAMQEVFSVDLHDLVAVKEVNRRLARADHCIYLVFEEGNDNKPAAEVSRELEAIATNTRERLERYLEFNKALDGTSWAMPRGNTCE